MKRSALQIGRQEILREIARGGLGVVYLAHDADRPLNERRANKNQYTMRQIETAIKPRPVVACAFFDLLLPR
jgi:hypothetical protein